MLQEPAIAGTIFVVLRITEEVFRKWRESRVTRNTEANGLPGEKRDAVGGRITNADCERRRTQDAATLDRVKLEIRQECKERAEHNATELERVKLEIRQEYKERAEHNATELREFRQSVLQTFEDMYNHGRQIGYDVKFLMGVISQFNEDRRHGKD